MARKAVKNSEQYIHASLILQVHTLLMHKPHSEQESSSYLPSIRRNTCKRYYNWEDNNRHEINLAISNNIGPPNL
jgi:hypothetical protein